MFGMIVSNKVSTILLLIKMLNHKNKNKIEKTKQNPELSKYFSIFNTVICCSEEQVRRCFLTTESADFWQLFPQRGNTMEFYPYDQAEPLVTF